MMVAFKTAKYLLLEGVLDPGVTEFGYSRGDLNVELCTTDKQHIRNLYCS